MPPRLLIKSELEKQKAKALVAEAQEGLKLTRRVDALRELQAKTEKELEDYRRASLEAIGREIRDALIKKELLHVEVAGLQEKADAVLPAIEKAQQEIVARAEELDTLMVDLVRRENKVVSAEWDVADLKKKAEREYKEAKKDSYEAQSLVEKLEGKNRELDVSLQASRELKDTILRDKAAYEAHISQQKELLKRKEDDLIRLEEELSRRSKELTNQEVKLADRRALLERNIKRMKHHE